MSTHRPRNECDLTPLEVRIPCGTVTLEGALAIPPGAKGVVVFAHGSGSSRHSPRNQFVAQVIRESGNGTLLFDLLTPDEEIERRFKYHAPEPNYERDLSESNRGRQAPGREADVLRGMRISTRRVTRK